VWFPGLRCEIWDTHIVLNYSSAEDNALLEMQQRVSLRRVTKEKQGKKQQQKQILRYAQDDNSPGDRSKEKARYFTGLFRICCVDL